MTWTAFGDGAGEVVPTRSSAFALARAVRERRLSAREVVEAHIAVLEQTQPRTNAVAATRFEAARREADAADARIAAAGPKERLPALPGVPCTVKEMIAVKGMPHTAGMLARHAVRVACPADG